MNFWDAKLVFVMPMYDVTTFYTFQGQKSLPLLSGNVKPSFVEIKKRRLRFTASKRMFIILLQF